MCVGHSGDVTRERGRRNDERRRLVEGKHFEVVARIAVEALDHDAVRDEDVLIGTRRRREVPEHVRGTCRRRRSRNVAELNVAGDDQARWNHAAAAGHAVRRARIDVPEVPERAVLDHQGAGLAAVDVPDVARFDRRVDAAPKPLDVRIPDDDVSGDVVAEEEGCRALVRVRQSGRVVVMNPAVERDPVLAVAGEPREPLPRVRCPLLRPPG